MKNKLEWVTVDPFKAKHVNFIGIGIDGKVVTSKMPILTKGTSFGGSFHTTPLWQIADKLRKNLKRRGLLKKNGTQLYKLVEQMDGWIMIEQSKELHRLIDKAQDRGIADFEWQKMEQKHLSS